MLVCPMMQTVRLPTLDLLGWKHAKTETKAAAFQSRFNVLGCSLDHFDPLASCEDLFMWKFGERMYSVLNHLEPTWTYRRWNWPADHAALFVLLCVVVCLFLVSLLFLVVFCFGCLFCLRFFCRHRDSNRTLYWSCLSSSFEAHLLEDGWRLCIN